MLSTLFQADIPEKQKLSKFRSLFSRDNKDKASTTAANKGAKSKVLSIIPKDSNKMEKISESVKSKVMKRFSFSGNESHQRYTVEI